MNTRASDLKTWLNSQLSHYTIQPLPGDASFRRYFRLTHDKQSYIVMDAPPNIENCVPFIKIAKGLAEKNLRVPHVYAADISKGFLLLSDLGNKLLLSTATHQNFYALYKNACDELAILQSCKDIPDYKIPPFNAPFMRNELELAKDWFLETHLQLALNPYEEMLKDFFYFLSESAAAQPQVFMHRDFQSANLMILERDAIGILDFQDAFMGPITYDLVSLLKDCYIVWPREMINSLALYYKHKACPEISDKEFLRWFDLMGLQRHIKALLTFSRKFHRDNNANYLKHMPRTLNYILTTSLRYKECNAFSKFLTTLLLPTFEKVTYQCMR